MHRMRRLFNRAMMEKEEVAILRGMLSAFETGPYKKPGSKPD
jgi:tRNA C32,U32 (ribose-2'-O)-methylase TrmJ